MKNKLFTLFNACAVFALMLLLILSACDKDNDNPHDDNSSLLPEEWAPQDLEVINVSIQKKKLSWSFGDIKIDGFKISRKIGNDFWDNNFAATPEEMWEWLDTLITPDTSLTYHYKVCAYAGDNQSNKVEVSSKVIFPEPVNFLVTPTNLSSVTLSWQYSGNGQEGFIVDRKTGNSTWQNNFAQISPSQVSYNDNAVSLDNNKYRYRVYAYVGQYKSDFVESSISKPEVSTAEVTNITPTSAFSGGSITMDGNYTITERGVCWSTSSNPTVDDEHFVSGNGPGSFTSNISGLLPITQYYIRAYANSILGPVYGESRDFNTVYSCGYAFTDTRDGSQYETVEIGNQCWMKENLAWLPTVSPFSNSSSSSPYYYVYNYNGTSITEAKATGYYQTYGVLYNWPAATNSCPDGWHLPTEEEWTTLINFLGGQYWAGGKMKEAGTAHWISPNQGATNSSGFTGLPGGNLQPNFGFYRLGEMAYWWSATSVSSNKAVELLLDHDYTDCFYYNESMDYGKNVRCLHD